MRWIAFISVPEVVGALTPDDLADVTDLAEWAAERVADTLTPDDVRVTVTCDDCGADVWTNGGVLRCECPEPLSDDEDAREVDNRQRVRDAV